MRSMDISAVDKYVCAARMECVCGRMQTIHFTKIGDSRGLHRTIKESNALSLLSHRIGQNL